MKTKNKLLFCFASSLLLGIAPTSHAQFGDLLKGMKDAAKELEKASQGQPPGGTDPLQQAPQNQSNPPEPVAARNAIKNDPSKLKEKADALLNLAAATYPALKTYDWGKKQWDFNVKYGAPPVSSNYTQMVKKELPDMFKTFGACSKKLGGGDINYDIVEKYFWSTDNKDIADARKMLNFLKSMGAENAPVRVPTKRSELNAAAENEQTLRLSVIDQYNNLLKFKTDKNWCEKFKDAD